MSKWLYSSEHAYNGYLKLNSCGKQWLFDHDYDIIMPNGRIDFSVRYVLKGLGHCNIDNKSVLINEGSLMFYPPEFVQNYNFKKEDQSVIMWAHFSGTACELLKNTTLKTPAVVKITDRKQFESAFEKMIVAHYKKTLFSENLSNSYMQVLISLIAQNSVFTCDNSNPKNENLEKILSIMHMNYNKPIEIKKYADICCVGEEHFIRLFKAYTGYPPYNYQLKIRIERAIEMLENTSINISDCAETVGFKDPAYFSRIFKRLTGHPPTYYKKF